VYFSTAIWFFNRSTISLDARPGRVPYPLFRKILFQGKTDPEAGPESTGPVIGRETLSA